MLNFPLNPQVMRILLGIFLGLLSGIAFGSYQWRTAGQRLHFDERIGIIEAHASQMKPGGIVVIGDSITEYNGFATLCGLPALNAGIAWARAADWLPVADKVARLSKPSVVVLAISYSDTYSNEWMADYRRLVAETGADLAIGTDDPKKDAFIKSLLPMVPRPPVRIYGKHPNAAGAKIWRASLEGLCRDQGVYAATTVPTTLEPELTKS